MVQNSLLKLFLYKTKHFIIKFKGILFFYFQFFLHSVLELNMETSKVRVILEHYEFRRGSNAADTACNIKCYAFEEDSTKKHTVRFWHKIAVQNAFTSDFVIEFSPPIP